MFGTDLKKYVANVSLAALVFLLLSVMVTSVIYSVAGERPISAVESPFLIEEEKLVRENPHINTVFIGSSVTYRGLDPAVFDVSVTATSDVHSYNLGNEGLIPMRSISYLEHFLRNPPPSVRNVFFELYKLDTVTYNYSSPAVMRVTGFRSFFEMLQTIRAANFPTRYKLWLAGQYARSLAFKALGFGMLSYAQYSRTLTPVDQERLAKSTGGYYPKDIEIEQTKITDNAELLLSIGAVLDEYPERIIDRTRINRDKYQQPWLLRSSPVLEELQQLVALAASRNIRLVYVLPPLLPPEAIAFAYPLYLSLPAANRLDISDPALFPELYKLENLFDFEHVNSKGAVYLSRYLADEFSRLVNE